jgi:NAD(P)H-dependent FMN reductase
MTKIAVIVGSTREGRVTDKLAKWVAVEAGKLADVEVVDLIDYPLPFFAEPGSPRYTPDRVPTADVKKWLDKVAEFDGYAIVTPEYNRAMPAVLKNAIDTIAYEMDDKPVALVAHGSAGGAQAVASLRIILPGIGVATIPTALFFTDGVGDAIDEAGVLKAELQEGPYSKQASLEAQMKSLVWYAEALTAAKNG